MALTSMKRCASLIMPSILRSTLSTPPPPSHQLIRSMSTLMPVYPQLLLQRSLLWQSLLPQRRLLLQPPTLRMASSSSRLFAKKSKSKTSKSHIRQSRSLMIVRPREYLHSSNVKHNPGSIHTSRREGRGGKGRTAGRGRKGWKARHPNSSRLPGFAGGQTPITKAFPKLGIQKKKGRSERGHLKPLHLDSVQHWIDMKRIDPTKKITVAVLIQSGCISRVRDGIFLLATGGQFLKTKIDIEVTRASVGAIQVVERIGGTVTTAYHNKEIIRAALYPEKYLQVRQLLVPANPQEIARYVDPERRGYLAPLVDGLDKKDIMQRILKEVKTLKKLNKVV
ncbi:hypothetical protein BASA61_000467 [Batrachochytrium salamandrivorans]|nr:hypothetical protein BASA61_000467 [Batrachochytrium salamandrivorans]